MTPKKKNIEKTFNKIFVNLQKIKAKPMYGKYKSKLIDGVCELKEEFRKQQKEIDKITKLLSLTADTCEQQVDELMEKQKQIDEINWLMI